MWRVIWDSDVKCAPAMCMKESEENLMCIVVSQSSDGRDPKKCELTIQRV